MHRLIPLILLTHLALYTTTTGAIAVPVDKSKGRGKLPVIAQSSFPPLHNVQRVFDVDFTGSQLGSCKNYEQRIKTAFEEVMQLVSGAEDAVRWLGQATLVEGDAQRREEREEGQLEDRPGL